MIRKPSVVKGIPSLLVRALPILYYYGRFAEKNIPAEAKSIFNSYTKYLSEAIKKMNTVVADKDLDLLVAEVNQLLNLDYHKIETEVFEITKKLSQFCIKNSEIIKKEFEGKSGSKTSLVDLFARTIEKTKILLLNNDNNYDWVNSLSKKLISKCYYDVTITKISADDFSDNIVKSDFVVFASATPQSIHEDVEFLKTYQKPGLILGSLQKDEKLDQQTIRNGSWLKSRGYDVLYKIFSPMRLFTTVDKINIRFMLNGT